MRETDGLAILELCLKLIPQTHEDVNKKVTLFQRSAKCSMVTQFLITRLWTPWLFSRLRTSFASSKNYGVGSLQSLISSLRLRLCIYVQNGISVAEWHSWAMPSHLKAGKWLKTFRTPSIRTQALGRSTCTCQTSFGLFLISTKISYRSSWRWSSTEPRCCCTKKFCKQCNLHTTIMLESLLLLCLVDASIQLMQASFSLNCWNFWVNIGI